MGIGGGGGEEGCTAGLLGVMLGDAAGREGKGGGQGGSGGFSCSLCNAYHINIRQNTNSRLLLPVILPGPWGFASASTAQQDTKEEVGMLTEVAG